MNASRMKQQFCNMNIESFLFKYNFVNFHEIILNIIIDCFYK